MSLPDYLSWHYQKHGKNLLLTYRNLLIFIFHYFSIPILLGTLFSPWKRQMLGQSRPGFHIDDILGAISFNIFSRIIGAVVRTITIVSGLIILLTTFLVGIPIILFFFLTPFLYVSIYVLSKTKHVSPIHRIISSAHGNMQTLVLKILATEEGKFLFLRLGIPLDQMKKYITSIYLKGDKNNFAAAFHHLKQQPDTTLADLVIVQAKNYEPLGKLFHQYSITDEDTREVSSWYKSLYTTSRFSLLHLESLLRIPGIGRDWAFGYTPTLDGVSSDLSSTYALFPKVVGREKEIMALERVLSKNTEGNALLIGEPGVGRHAIVYGFSRMVETGWSLPSLFDKRIVLLDIKLLSAEKQDQLEIKKRLGEILKEAREAGNIIIVIDTFEKHVSFADVFSQYLSDGRLKIIGITDPIGYHQYIRPNTTLSPLYEKVEVVAPSEKAVMKELELAIVPVLEAKHDAFITFPTLKEAIKDASMYQSEKPFPEKAIDLLDEALVYIKIQKKERILSPHHIQEFLSIKTKIPIGNLGRIEKDKLEKLEELIHKEVINQHEAVEGIANSLRRRRALAIETNRPIGSFLFLGPTGVGKTETAKALARIYYGSVEKILRFDMSQYQKDEGIEKLIGSIKLGTPGDLASKIRDNPFSLLLLDEIEKADKQIYNLFLPLLDEGYIDDAFGRRIDTRNLFVIATSNAGSEYIRQSVLGGIKGSDLQKLLIDYIQKEKIFSPEFLNRFDGVVVFTPLSEGHMKEVTKLMLVKLNQQLAKQTISIDITEDLIKKLTALGFDPVFGARAIKRVITEKIENQVAQKVINGEVKKGDRITIDI